VVTELSSAISGGAEAESAGQEAEVGFAHPPHGEQEKSAERDETLGEGEKSG
jgi:hypothetical protein